MYQMSVLQAVGSLESRVHDLTVVEEETKADKRKGGKKGGKDKSPFS